MISADYIVRGCESPFFYLRIIVFDDLDSEIMLLPCAML